MDETGSPVRCQACGGRFMGEQRAEVVRKADGNVIVIHQDCFDAEKHEVA